MTKKQTGPSEVMTEGARAATDAPPGSAHTPVMSGAGSFRRAVLAALPELERAAGRSLGYSEAVDAFEQRESGARLERDRRAAVAAEDEAGQRHQEAQRQAQTAIRRKTAEHLLAAENERCLGLAKLQRLSAGFGVQFDLDEAISCGMTVEAAREAVLDAKATAEEQQPTTPVATTHTVKDANAAGEAKAGWDAAVDKVAKRRGLSMRVGVPTPNDRGLGK